MNASVPGDIPNADEMGQVSVRGDAAVNVLGRAGLAVLLFSIAVAPALAGTGDAVDTKDIDIGVIKIQLKYADAREIAQLFTAESGGVSDGPMVMRAAPADAHLRPFAPEGTLAGTLPNPRTYARFFPAKARIDRGATALLPDGIVGQPLAYPRDNSIIVKGTQAALDEFRELLRALDVPAKQVKIRAKVVSTLNRKAYEQGIEWFSRSDAYVVSANGHAPPGALTIRYGRAGYSVLAGVGETREKSLVISEPFVVTTTMHPVDLSVATMYPYFSPLVQYTPWGVQIVSYRVLTVAVGVDLFVLPRVNPDDTIRLSIAPVYSEIVGGRTAPDGQVLPVIAANDFATTVTVRDGETVCIAGLPRERTGEVSIGVPYLPPFGSRRESETSEILVFVTPQIVRGPAVTE